jgi:hypothetical protein
MTPDLLARVAFVRLPHLHLVTILKSLAAVSHL